MRNVSTMATNSNQVAPICPISFLTIPKFGERTIYLDNGIGGKTVVNLDALNEKMIEAGFPEIKMPRMTRDYDFISYLMKHVTMKNFTRIQPLLKRLGVHFNIS